MGCVYVLVYSVWQQGDVMSFKIDLALHGIGDGWLVSMTEDSKGDTSPAPLLASDTDSITTDLSPQLLSPSPPQISQPSFLSIKESQPYNPSAPVHPPSPHLTEPLIHYGVDTASHPLGSQHHILTTSYTSSTTPDNRTLHRG